MSFLGRPFHRLPDPIIDEDLKERVLERMELDPHIDFERGTWWVDVTLAGRKMGRLDEHNKEVNFDLSPEEIEEILMQPPLLPGSRQKELTCTIKI